MGGFFGTIQKKQCTTDLFYGTDYNSHLGTEKGGLATLNRDRKFARAIHSLKNAYFRNKFEDELPKMTGKAGIGVISDTDSQPIIMNSKLGHFAIVTVAYLYNKEELVKKLIEEDRHFTEFSGGEVNQTELIAQLIIQKDDFVSGIEYMFSQIQGSCSLMILNEEGIIAARDKLGRTPIVIAKKEDGYAISSEPCGLPNLGFETDYFVGPGEILNVTAEGYTQLRKPNEKMQICSFLWVYYGYPVSDYEARNVDEVRYKAGFESGKEDKTEADFVAAIPDSGIGYALGFAAGVKLPYQRAMVKYTPTWPRSFTPPTQALRELVAKMKLIPNKTLLKDRRVIFSDDSIVRGTQLKDNVEFLYGYGAKEVHMRISAPPLLYPCKFIGFTRSNSDMELITRRIIAEYEGAEHVDKLPLYQDSSTPEYAKMVENMRKQFNLTSLSFNKLDNLVNAIGLPKCKVCTHCFDGTSYF